MLKNVFAVGIFFTAVLPYAALGRTPGYNETTRCQASSDPFAIAAYIPGLLPGEGRDGPLSRPVFKPSDAGLCVDQSDYRPALQLEPSELGLFGFSPDLSHIYVANVNTMNGWYSASIPFLSAREANFLVAIRHMPILGVRGGHAELRVFFNDPVVLTPQWPANPDERLETHELVFTANPTGFSGPARHDPVKNFDGSLLNARGIQTREKRLMQSFIKSHTFTEKQYRLNLEPWELAKYIARYVELATKTRLTQRFILTTRNCDSTQFEVLDSVLAHRYNIKQFPFDPEFAKQRLRERNLISENSELAPFEQEPFAQEMFAKFGRAPEE